MKRQAIAELPLDRLTPERREKAQTLISGLGLYRRLPTVSFEVDRQVYAYFLKNPDVRGRQLAHHGNFEIHAGGIGPGRLFGRCGRRLAGNRGSVFCDAGRHADLLPRCVQESACAESRSWPTL